MSVVDRSDWHGYLVCQGCLQLLLWAGRSQQQRSPRRGQERPEAGGWRRAVLSEGLSAIATTELDGTFHN